MGLCPSRNHNIAKKDISFEQGSTPLVPPRAPAGQLRASATAFKPPRTQEQAFQPKESWELFLAAKEKQVYKAPGAPPGLTRGSDGTYTSGYRELLTSKMGAAPWKQAKKPAAQWRCSEPEPVEKKKKLTSLKKKILAQRVEGVEDASLAKFAAFVDQRQKARPVPQVAEAPRFAVDEPKVGLRLEPFGLSSRGYDSDCEDANKSQRHLSTIAVERRQYVPTPVSPAMDAAVTSFLFELRGIKMQEVNMGVKGRKRYAVGFREVSRMMTNGRGKCLLVAPDMEESAPLEAKVAGIVQACKDGGIPVIYALSRRQFGQAVQKNVAISVMGIEDVKGVEGLFEAMLAAQ